MLWAAGPGEGDVQCLCCNIRSPTPAEERACHRVVMEPHHSSVIFHHHIDVTEDKCTVREDPPDPTDFPAPFNSLEKCLKCVCVCVCLSIAPLGQSFWRPPPAKSIQGLKAGVPPGGCHLVPRDAEKTPRTATPPLWAVPASSASCEEGGFSIPAIWDVSWASQRWEMPTSPMQVCWEALGKVNLARWRFALAVDGGWSIPSLPTRGSTLPELCSSWVTGAHAGSFLKGHSRAGALPWGKGCRQNLHRAAQHPTAILSATAEQSRSLRMADVTVYYRRITQYLYPEMHKLWEAAKLRWLLLVWKLDITTRHHLILIMLLTSIPRNSKHLILPFVHSIQLWHFCRAS